MSLDDEVSDGDSLRKEFEGLIQKHGPIESHSFSMLLRMIIRYEANRTFVEVRKNRIKEGYKADATAYMQELDIILDKLYTQIDTFFTD